MAYANKYTLDFSDVEGHAYRLLIQEKNYTGNSSLVKGGKSPIIIRYDGEDNEYSEIYGSSATIMLYEETLNQFDDLISTSEKKHKVILKYYNVNQATPAYENYWIGFLVGDDMARSINPLPNLLKFKAFDGLSLLKGRDAFLVERTAGNRFNRIFWNVLKQLNFDDDNEATSLQFWHSTNYFHVEYIINSSFLSDRLLTFLFSTTPFQFKNGYAIFNSKELMINMLRAIGCRIYQAQGYWMIDQNQGLLDSYIQQQTIDYARTLATNPFDNMGNLIRNRLQNTFAWKTKWHKYGTSTGNFFSYQIDNRLKIVPGLVRAMKLKEFYKPSVKEIANVVDISQFEKRAIMTNSGFEYNGDGLFPQYGNQAGWYMGASNSITNYRPNGYIRGIQSKIRKQGNYSFFTNAIEEMTISRFAQLQSNFNNSYREGTSIYNGLTTNRLRVKGFTENIKVEVDVYVEMDPIPSDNSVFVEKNAVSLPYKIYLYETLTNGSGDIQNLEKVYQSNFVFPDTNFDNPQNQWNNPGVGYDGPANLLQKANYNKWKQFSGNIASPFDRNSSRADEDFYIVIELFAPHAYFGPAGSSSASNTSQDLFPELKGVYIDNVNIFIEDLIESPKTFQATIDQNSVDNSEKITIKNRGFGNYQASIFQGNSGGATIDNFTTEIWARPQAIEGSVQTKRENAKNLPELINQDIANNHRSRQKVYEGQFKVNTVYEKPIKFSDKLWMAFGVDNFLNYSQNDFSDADENVCSINKMTFNVKANEYDITATLCNQRTQAPDVATFDNGDVTITNEITLGKD